MWLKDFRNGMSLPLVVAAVPLASAVTRRCAVARLIGYSGVDIAVAHPTRPNARSSP